MIPCHLAAHMQAWEKKRYIHRDISSGNILLFYYTDDEGNLRVIGVLNDWGLCQTYEYLQNVSRPAHCVSPFRREPGLR